MKIKSGYWLMTLIFLLVSANINAEEKIDDQLFKVVRTGDLAQLEKLLAQNVKVNYLNQRGFTPLIMAAYYGHESVIDRLSQAGAEVCAVDKKGSNAMMGAAFRGHIHVIKWMLKNSDCNINHRNYAGQTTLMMAALFGRSDIVDLLLEHGADPEVKDVMGNQAASLAAGQGQKVLAEKLTM